jgi:hypothetical protein
VVSVAGFGSTVAVPQGMQQLIGFASPPQKKQNDTAQESRGDKRERVPKQSQSARRDQ